MLEVGTPYCFSQPSMQLTGHLLTTTLKHLMGVPSPTPSYIADTSVVLCGTETNDQKLPQSCEP